MRNNFVAHFYSDQERDIEGVLGERFPSPRPCTIDSIQGYGASIVVMSCTKCNKDKTVGFLAEDNRHHVA